MVLVNHQDTVWPHGTLERIPFSHEDGVVRGPGSFDMLTGAVMSVHATAMLIEQGGPEAVDGLSIVVTGDEEVGSHTGAPAAARGGRTGARRVRHGGRSR